MTSAPDPRQCLTAEQVAELTGLKVKTLYGWRLRGGGPPSFKLGSRIVYRAGDVHDWLDRQYERTRSA